MTIPRPQNFSPEMLICCIAYAFDKYLNSPSPITTWSISGGGDETGMEFTIFILENNETVLNVQYDAETATFQIKAGENSHTWDCPQEFRQRLPEDLSNTTPQHFADFMASLAFPPP